MKASFVDTMFVSRADFTAVASTASEASLLAGLNNQPVFPAFEFTSTDGFGKAYRLKARGVFSTTGTPTMTFQARLGSTAGSTYLSGTSVGVTAAITTQSGVTNKWFEINLDMIVATPGLGASNTTIICVGSVVSPTGFASPFLYPVEPTTPDTATWTATVDGSVAQYLNVSLTWSASSASNTCTLKELIVMRLN